MNNRTAKVFIILVMVGYVFLGCSDKDVSARSPSVKTMSKKTILDKTVNRTLMKVDKLSCGACLTAISQKLSNFDGVAGLGADLRRGLVAVDHSKGLESKKIADAITSIGYPATVLSVEEIDSRRTFASSSSGQYGGSCCGGSGYSKRPSSDKETNSSEGCPYVESVRSRGCYANSASWKKLFEKFSQKSEDTNK